MITVKMALLVLLSIVFLWSISEVLSQCPPSSGKSLDVYNSNCIGFIGIYLMHNGNCYTNGSYFLIIISKELVTVLCVCYLVLL